MASCNLSYSGHTGVLAARAYVTEISTSGTSRYVNLRVTVYALDYSGARDAAYAVSCSDSGTNVTVPMYSGFTVTGSEKEIFNESFYVDISGGSSTAGISFSFSASVYSGSAGANRTISGSITQLYLTAGSSGNPSMVSLNAGSVQMGKKLLISIDRESTACTHKLTCWYSDSVEIEIAKNVETLHTWTVSDLAYLCKNATSGKFWIVCYTYCDGEYVGYTEESVTLTVPDPTTPSIDGDAVTLGTKATVSCKRNSTSFTVELKLTFKETTVSIKSGSFDSAAWTPAYDLAKQIPNLTYGTGTLTCVTKNGTATVGTKTSTIRVHVPNNSTTRPSFTASGLKLSPVSSLAEVFSGLYIRGMTGMKAEFTASSKYSTVKNYSITVGAQTASGNPATVKTLTVDGDVKVTAKVTDARGYSTSVSVTVKILPYQQPRVIPHSGYADVICERALENGALSSKGTYLAIKAGRSFTSIVVNGVNQNKCSLQYRWKTGNAGSFSGWITILADSSTENEKSILISDVVSSLQTSYIVEIRVTDTLQGSHSMRFQIMTEAISFVLYDGPDGAGFGKYPEAPHVVDIASHMKLLVRGELEVTGEEWISLGLASGIGESSYEFGRAPTGCYYRVTNGNHVYVAFNCSFAYEGSSMRVNLQDIPAAYRPKQAVSSFCRAGSRTLACAIVNSSGVVKVEFVQNLTVTGNTASAAVNYVDGYLDYFI